MNYILIFQIICGKAVCNLLRYPESQMATARCGALPVIKVLATLQSEECKISCTCALAVLSTHQACRQIIIQERAASVLVLLSQSTEKKTVVVDKSWSCLSFYPNLRSALVMLGSQSFDVHYPIREIH